MSTGRDGGKQVGAIMDYGSLIWVTLQRSKTAREAVKTIDHLLQTYGYSSSGESFSIGDTKEAWLMEIYPKGTELGAVWVASRVPDGYVGSHANQARTRTFKMDDPDNVLFAKDVVTYAQRKGWYPKDKPAEEFDFTFSNKTAWDPLCLEVRGKLVASGVRVWQQQTNIPKDSDNCTPSFSSCLLLLLLV